MWIKSNKIIKTVVVLEYLKSTFRPMGDSPFQSWITDDILNFFLQRYSGRLVNILEHIYMKKKMNIVKLARSKSSWLYARTVWDRVVYRDKRCEQPLVKSEILWQPTLAHP